jgi:Spy/CpxP family protein refolding chaperone
MRGQWDWRRHMTHRFSLAGLALRHQQELALTPAQVQSLRQLDTDTQREAIKRQADRLLAELDLRTLMMPDPTDPDKPRDLAKIEVQVREIERLRADGRIARVRAMEQSRQILTPEQRQKLRMLFAERWLHRGPRGPEAPRMHGMAPYDDRHESASRDES